MNNIEYKDLDFNRNQILNLYNDNEWTNYTMDESSLFQGISNSLYTKAAYDKDLLVALIRVVGDGNTIIYIQDLLVLKNYQRQGIGKKLLSIVINKYENVRQICLTTDLSENQKKFYISCGFKDYYSKNIIGFIYDK